MNDLEEIEKILSDSELSIADMVSKFRNFLMKEQVELLRMSADSKDIEAKQEKVDKMQKIFAGLEKMYYSKLRMDKLMGKRESNNDKSFMDSIRAQKDSIGDIIRENT